MPRFMGLPCLMGGSGIKVTHDRRLPSALTECVAQVAAEGDGSLIAGGVMGSRTRPCPRRWPSRRRRRIPAGLRGHELAGPALGKDEC